MEDRKGHDRRYAIKLSKIHRELGWLPETFAEGIKKTINWYLESSGVVETDRRKGNENAKMVYISTDGVFGGQEQTVGTGL